jgi:hypothetical protein
MLSSPATYKPGRLQSLSSRHCVRTMGQWCHLDEPASRCRARSFRQEGLQSSSGLSSAGSTRRTSRSNSSCPEGIILSVTSCQRDAVQCHGGSGGHRPIRDAVGIAVVALTIPSWLMCPLIDVRVSKSRAAAVDLFLRPRTRPRSAALDEPRSHGGDGWRPSPTSWVNWALNSASFWNVRSGNKSWGCWPLELVFGSMAAHAGA